MATTNPNTPTVRILSSEDYKGIIQVAPGFDQFIQDLNRFIIPSSNLLSGGIVPGTNTNEEYYPFSITANGLTGSVNTFSFTPRKFVGTPRGVEMVACIPNSAVPVVPSTLPGIHWIPGSGGTVNIDAIYGLQTGVEYNIMVRIS